MKLLLWMARVLLPSVLLIALGPAKAGPPAAVTPAPGKALVVFHTRVAAAKAIPEGRLVFRPYDRATGRLGVNGFDTRGHQFTAGRWIGLVSNKSMRNWKGWAVEVEPGSYVVASLENPNLAPMGDSLFSHSWAFDVAPGTVTYVGDFTLKWTKLSRGWGLDVVAELDEPRARAFVAAKAQTQAPFVAAPVRPVALSRNADRSWTVTDSH
jgi:hypothetical protein